MSPKKASEKKTPSGGSPRTFKRQVDYSMPRQNGLFPPPPYHYPHMRALIVIVTCAPGVKEKFLPPELKPLEDGFDSIFISEYPNSTVGPYNENLILLQCEYKGEPGSFVFNIYVDDDSALTAGREIWGYPKKMCNISLSPIQNKKVRGTLTRKGVTFLDIEATILDEPPGMDPKGMIEGMPLYNVKLIPDVADNTKPALRQLTVTNMKYGEFYQQFGAKVNYIKTVFSLFDTCHEVLNGAKCLDGFYVECDQILPNGRVLQ